MTFSGNPILSIAAVVCIVTYLGAFIYLTTYLRRVYTMTWMELGSFLLWDTRRRDLNGLMEWFVAGCRTLGFALFGNQYRAVQDRKLTFVVWLVRVSFALSLVFVLVSLRHRI